jgi:hypothetical protein
MKPVPEFFLSGLPAIAACRLSCSPARLRRFGLVCFVLSLARIAAEAHTIPVTDTSDTSNPNTLRDALANAGDGDTILLPSSGVFSMGTIYDDASNYMGPTATPLITKSITIEGNGSRLEHVANGLDFRAFAVASSGNLTLKDLHIKDSRLKAATAPTAVVAGSAQAVPSMSREAISRSKTAPSKPMEPWAAVAARWSGTPAGAAAAWLATAAQPSRWPIRVGRCDTDE